MRFPALLCIQSEDAFCQKVSHKYEDFSRRHRNDDQDCKKTEEGFAYFTSTLVFHEIDSFTAMEDYFSLLSLLFF